MILEGREACIPEVILCLVAGDLIFGKRLRHCDEFGM